MVSYKLQVTQEHIDKGTRCESKSCAITLALIGAFPDITHVDTYGHTADFCFDGGVHFIEHDGLNFIVRFDSKYGLVGPTTINLEIHDQTARALGILEVEAVVDNQVEEQKIAVQA